MVESHYRAELQSTDGASDREDAFKGELGVAAREKPGDTPWGNDHPVNIRLSIPLPAGRWYVTVLAGRERRDAERRREERQKHSLLTSGNMAFLFIVGVVIGGGCWMAVQSLLLWIFGLINA